jgi:hypothetical protein
VARNANIEQFDVAGVDALTIARTNEDKINEIDDDEDNIMSITTIPPANNPNPLVLPDTLDNDNADANDDESSNDNKSSNYKSSNDNNPGTQGEIAVDKPAENPAESQDQGVHSSKRKNKGKTPGKYKDYGIMMNKQRKVRGGQRCTTIHNGLMFFLAEDLSDAKPVADDEDRKEWVLGVALTHYSMGTGIKKFWERAKAGVTKELTQMHNMNVFQPVARESLSKEERAKALALLMFCKE